MFPDERKARLAEVFRGREGRVNQRPAHVNAVSELLH